MATTNETKQITVLIAGRPYSLKVMLKDVDPIRRIVKEINEKIDKFQVTYPSREQKDCMALSLLSFGTDLHKIHLDPSLAATQYQANLSKRLGDIDILLDSLLEE